MKKCTHRLMSTSPRRSSSVCRARKRSFVVVSRELVVRRRWTSVRNACVSRRSDWSSTQMACLSLLDITDADIVGKMLDTDKKDAQVRCQKSESGKCDNDDHVRVTMTRACSRRVNFNDARPRRGALRSWTVSRVRVATFVQHTHPGLQPTN